MVSSSLPCFTSPIAFFHLSNIKSTSAAWSIKVISLNCVHLLCLGKSFDSISEIKVSRLKGRAYWRLWFNAQVIPKTTYTRWTLFVSFSTTKMFFGIRIEVYSWIRSFYQRFLRFRGSFTNQLIGGDSRIPIRCQAGPQFINQTKAGSQFRAFCLLGSFPTPLNAHLVPFTRFHHPLWAANMSTYDSNIARRSDGLGSKETLPFQSIYNATSARSSIVIAPHTWDWHWYYVFYLLFAYQVVFILWRFWCKAPVGWFNAATLLVTDLHSATLLLLLTQRSWGGGWQPCIWLLIQKHFYIMLITRYVVILHGQLTTNTLTH